MVQDGQDLLETVSTLVQISLPPGGHITIVGDLHGQFFDLTSIIEKNGEPGPANPYIFNGDFVDRGSFSVETMLTLLAWKLAMPTSVHLARGNHEAHSMNALYGFAGEVLTKYDMPAYAAFQRFFHRLPLAHVVNGDIFVVHGGLTRVPDVRLEDIGSLDRVALSRGRHPGTWAAQLFTDLLWTDPRDHQGYHKSGRGGNNVTFGPDVTRRFLDKNGLSLVIRSHEVKKGGFEWHHAGQCLTVFSAPRYGDMNRNHGAVVRLTAPVDGGPIHKDVRVFDVAPRPPNYIRGMAYSPLSPLCPRHVSLDALKGMRSFLVPAGPPKKDDLAPAEAKPSKPPEAAGGDKARPAGKPNVLKALNKFIAIVEEGLLDLPPKLREDV